jgi:ElaA protein
MTGIAWRAAAFDELSPRDAHDVLRLRQDVFVIEQNCVFHEIDGRDPLAVHLLGRSDDRLVAYARIFAPGVVALEASIGRVVTDASVRGTGLGRPLMREALRVADALAPRTPVRVAAQAHLEDFYASLGFRTVGESYVEDGMMHLDMVRPPDDAPRGADPATG